MDIPYEWERVLLNRFHWVTAVVVGFGITALLFIEVLVLNPRASTFIDRNEIVASVLFVGLWMGLAYTIRASIKWWLR